MNEYVRKRKVPPDVVALMSSLLEKGKTLKQIALVAGVKYSTLRIEACKLGLVEKGYDEKNKEKQLLDMIEDPHLTLQDASILSRVPMPLIRERTRCASALQRQPYRDAHPRDKAYINLLVRGIEKHRNGLR